MELVKYNDSLETKWDQFIDKNSINGNLLQTRRFLNYHSKEKFIDASLLFMKGSNIIAVIPANCAVDAGEKIFYSHQGSTFGGLIIGNQYKKIAEIEEILDLLEQYLVEEKYDRAILKQTSELYSKDETEFIHYMLFNRDYRAMAEVGYYLQLEKVDKEQIENTFSASRRRDYRYSLKHNFSFREIRSEEIKEFYSILLNNMEKFHTNPVHSYDEIMDLYQNKIPGEVKLYGVFDNDEMIAGSMVFDFYHKVLHTQYLATKQDRLGQHPNEFMYYSLINQAIIGEFPYVSFGTATLEHGKVLNKSLAQFKEGFGTNQFINYTYYKSFK